MFFLRKHSNKDYSYWTPRRRRLPCTQDGGRGWVSMAENLSC
jgi:hypothetical protein